MHLLIMEQLQVHVQSELRSIMKLKCVTFRSKHLNVPQTITCHVLSSEVLKALGDALLHKGNAEHSNGIEIGFDKTFFQGLEADFMRQPSSCNNPNMESSLVLAGLHACGDLSVTMLRTFLECEDVKAVVSIGCCYNLLSEECSENTSSKCGFPMSDGAALAGLSLGKNLRDLACQSAERWRSLTEVAALQNFELHAFRAAFQMVLHKYYPEVLSTIPSIGRQGKALRRQQQRRDLHTHLHVKDSVSPSVTCQGYPRTESCSTMKFDDVGMVQEQMTDMVPRDGETRSALDAATLSHDKYSNCSSRCEDTQSPDRYPFFEKFCKSGLCRLGLVPLEGIDFLEIWMEARPFAELIGPYWSLRAALGPVVETLLLLDRLLYLQEQGNSVEAVVLPLFDPILSPRNVAIIAQKK